MTSLDWFVSIGLAPLSFALTAPVSAAIGIDATFVVAGVGAACSRSRCCSWSPGYATSPARSAAKPG